MPMPGWIKRAGGRLRRGEGRKGREPAEERESPERIELGDITASPEGRLASLRGRLRRPRFGGRGRLAGLAGGIAAGLTRIAGFIGRAANAVGGLLADLWLSLRPEVRKGIAAGGGVAAVAALVWFVLLPLGPCGLPGADRCPPTDHAAELVPANALAYGHVNLDPDTDQYEAAAELAGRLPEIAGDLIQSASELLPHGLDYERQIETWAGGELAVALLGRHPEPAPLLLVEVEDAEAARETAVGLLGGEDAEIDESRHEGATISVGPGGDAFALIGGFLAIGAERELERVAEVAAGDRPALAAEPGVAEVRDRLPEDRLADAYLSAAGARALDGLGALGPFETFIDAGRTAGVAAALVAGDDQLEIAVRGALDPELVEARGPTFFATLPTLEPELSAEVAENALAYLGLGNPREGIEALIEGAADAAPDLVRAYRRFTRRLERDDGIDFEDEVIPLLGEELAISLEPPAGRELTEGLPAELRLPREFLQELPENVRRVPYLSLLADGIDPDRARDQLARIQGALAAALDPGEAGRTARFRSAEIDGVEVQALQSSLLVWLTYAAFDERLAVATNPAGIARLRAGGDGLDDAERFKRATHGLPGEAAVLLYVDLPELVESAAELFQLGRAHGDPGVVLEDPLDRAYVRLRDDLRTLEAAAIAIRGGEAELATDLRVVIGERQDPEPEPALPGLEP